MGSAQTASSLNILVVEDDENLRLSIIDALRGCGYLVRGIDCAAALPKKNDFLPLDLAVLEVDLPDESGFSLAQRMRVAKPDLGVILLSARATPEDPTPGYVQDADIYLTKPVSLGELDEAVSALARRLRTKRAPQNSMMYSTVCL